MEIGVCDRRQWRFAVRVFVSMPPRSARFMVKPPDACGRTVIVHVA